MPGGAAMANAQNGFAPPMSTQPPPRTEQVQPTVPDVEQEEHQAVHALDAAGAFLPDVDAPHEQPLQFTDVLTEAQLKTHGLGENGAMLFAASSKGGEPPIQRFQDRILLRKILLHGAAEIHLSQLVDKMGDKVHVPKADGTKRTQVTRHRPSQLEAGHESNRYIDALQFQSAVPELSALQLCFFCLVVHQCRSIFLAFLICSAFCQVRKVLQAAIAAYPRLWQWEPNKPGTLKLLAWSPHEKNRILYHNECMRACSVSLRQAGAALFSDAPLCFSQILQVSKARLLHSDGTANAPNTATSAATWLCQFVFAPFLHSLHKNLHVRPLRVSSLGTSLHLRVEAALRQRRLQRAELHDSTPVFD